MQGLAVDFRKRYFQLGFLSKGPNNFTVLAVCFAILTSGCVSYHVVGEHSPLTEADSAVGDLAIRCDNQASELVRSDGKPLCAGTGDKPGLDAEITAETYRRKSKDGNLDTYLTVWTLGIFPSITENDVETRITVKDREGNVVSVGYYRSNSTEYVSWLVLPLWIAAGFSDSLRIGTNDTQSPGLWEAHENLIAPALPDLRHLEALATIRKQKLDRIAADEAIWNSLKSESTRIPDLFIAADRVNAEKYKDRIGFAIQKSVEDFAADFIKQNTKLHPEWPVIFMGDEPWGKMAYLFTGFALTDSGPGSRQWEVVDGRECFKSRLYSDSLCLRWMNLGGSTYYLVLVPDGDRYLIPGAGENGSPFRSQVRIKINTLLGYLNVYPGPEHQRNPAIKDYRIPKEYFEEALKAIPDN